MKVDTLSKTALAMSLALSLPGCFNYIPTQLEATPPGEEVRIMVTPEGVLELSEVTGVDLSNPVVRGEILGREANEILLSVPGDNVRRASTGCNSTKQSVCPR